MKRVAIMCALALLGCSDDPAPSDPNLWLAEKVCGARVAFIDATATKCGTLVDDDGCIRRELEEYADPVCGSAAIMIAVCASHRLSVCQPDGTLVLVSGGTCADEVADYYACLRAKDKGRTTPWPVGGDAGLARDGGGR